jgi:hypothetical protein
MELVKLFNFYSKYSMRWLSNHIQRQCMSLMQLWHHDRGVPQVRLDTNYDHFEATTSEGSLYIEDSWCYFSNYSNRFFLIRVALERSIIPYYICPLNYRSKRLRFYWFLKHWSLRIVQFSFLTAGTYLFQLHYNYYLEHIRYLLKIK